MTQLKLSETHMSLVRSERNQLRYEIDAYEMKMFCLRVDLKGSH